MPRLRARRADLAWQAFERDRPLVIAIDTETEGVEFYDRPFAAQVTWRRSADELESHYFELGVDGLAENVLEDILRLTPLWVAHNLKFDLQKLILVGLIDPDEPYEHGLHDTQTMYTLLDENQRKGLKELAVRVLRYDDTITVPYASGPKKGQTRQVSREKYELDAARRRLKLKKEDGYHLLPRRVVIPYALKDTEFTLQLYEKLLPKVDEKGLREFYNGRIEYKLELLRGEARGMKLDLPRLEALTSEWGVKVMSAWSLVLAITKNENLNPNAPAQLDAEFVKRGHILPDTQVATLEQLDDDLARAVLAYRAVKKTHTTYLVGLLKAQRNGRVHPSMNDDGARTGRMSSSTAKE